MNNVCWKCTMSGWIASSSSPYDLSACLSCGRSNSQFQLAWSVCRKYWFGSSFTDATTVCSWRGDNPVSGTGARATKNGSTSSVARSAS
jgi:hypothetical protein